MYHKNICLVLAAIDICVAFICESYKNILRRSKFDEVIAVIKHNLIILLAALMYMYMTQVSFMISRFILIGSIMIATALMIGVRCVWKRHVRHSLSASAKNGCLLVITKKDLAVKTVKKLQRSQVKDYQIVGLVLLDESDKVGDCIEGVPIVSKPKEMLEYAKVNIVDEVFINLIDNNQANKIARQFLKMGIIVHINLAESMKSLSNLTLEKVGDFPVVTSSIHVASPLELLLKRIMDIAGSIVGMVFTIIAFIIFAPIIYIQSPGKVLLAQERVGRGGRHFKIYKFRSMYPDAEERKAELMKQNKMKGNMFKLDDDPRVIPIGRFMRRYSIDELPQFFNILKGDMSLVGTRPPTVDEVEQYKMHHMVRLSFRPGLTGLWQINGRSEITDFEQVVKLDEKYITDWSLKEDVKIILKTIVVVLKGKGAV
jgi:exopolysaccharide biosynthesis polyprenyl glycosylphosphotransferase